MKAMPNHKDEGESPGPNSTTNPWKRGLILLVVAIPLFLILTVPVAWYFFFYRGSNLTPIEREVLNNLRNYDARPEYDKKTGHVERVVLHGAHVDDSVLDEVAKLPFLRRLSLNDSSITDSGLPKLRPLKRLENLSLTGTRVTDEGLGLLENMPSLRNVYVFESEILTGRGIGSLRKSLPNTKISVLNDPSLKKKDQKGKKKDENK
jgi:hypothetical protein